MHDISFIALAADRVSEEILAREALVRPRRVYATEYSRQEDQMKALSQALKEMMRKDLLNDKQI